MTTKIYIIDQHYDNKNSTIIENNGELYSCTLNQTDIKTNKNKFYIMQLLKDGNNIVHYTRYGRIGEVGKIIKKSVNNQEAGIMLFEKQFKTKTGNNWVSKNNFTKKPGKYFLTETSYEQELANIPKNILKIPDSTLDTPVYNLIKMLGDPKMMNAALVDLNIDTKKMPLGKLGKKQLDAASDILDSISVILNKTNKNNTDTENIINLSSNYYTYIPYSCGRQKPPLIDNTNMISKQKEKIEELRNIVIGAQIVNNVNNNSDVNPIDSIYNDIKTNIKLLDNNTEIYKEIVTWIKNTHGPTHGCKLSVLDIYEVEQQGIKQQYNNMCKDYDNKTLLFHGTHQSCVLSIFKNNFYLDPSKLKNGANIQIAGKMFGYGVYWADVATKSFNYTRAQSSGDIGCLLVGEIALGNISTRTSSDYKINKDTLEKVNCHSIKALGKWQPSSSKIIDNIYINNGPLEKQTYDTDLRYNEYIVYDINQIFTKYLVLVKNSGNYSGY